MSRFKCVVFCLLCIRVISLKAQTNHARYSPRVMQYLHQGTTEPEHGVVMYNSNNTQYISALIQVNNAINPDQLKELGVVVRTKAGSIWTVHVPKAQFQSFSQLAGITYVEMDRRVKLLMDSARYVTGVDSVQEGINLPLPFSGKDVVIGVVDDGFDYTHPSFFDTTYTQLRIQKVWDQHGTGTPPPGYTYGNELPDTGSILAQKYSTTKEDHGTITSTIAGGSGYGSKNNRLYRGVAYACDFVLVTAGFDYPEIRGMTITQLIDAFNYIFSYAQSVGKPAVINVSIGGWTGPHDGTSLFAQACNNLSGPGKILVFGAGNDGLNKIHLEKTFTASDTAVSTILTMPYKANYAELWGDVGTTFCIELGLFNQGIKGAKTQRYCIDKNVQTTYLVGTDNDTSFITITSQVNALNNKPLITVEVTHNTLDSFYLTIIADTGTVHFWDEQWGDLLGNGMWAVDGDSRYTISEMACASSIITVTAFTSKMTYKNLQKQALTVESKYAKNKGEFALFSSMGPTIDGRMKPNITAPGCMITSATNSYSPAFCPGGTYYFLSVAKFTSPITKQTYYYSVNQGTSVAAPMVTGIVALMLQANPSLGPQTVIDILTKTAITDTFTTANPDASKWGAGKINAYGALKETLQSAGTVRAPQDDNSLSVFPNPSQGVFSLFYESQQKGYLMVEVLNPLGELIKSQSWPVSMGKNLLEVHLDDVKKGVYFIHLSGYGGAFVKKVLVN